MRATRTGATSRQEIPKSPTATVGLNQITACGPPRGHPSRIGKSAIGGMAALPMEFFVRGATQSTNPGVFMSLKEAERELRQNVASMDFNLQALTARTKPAIGDSGVEQAKIEEADSYMRATHHFAKLYCIFGLKLKINGRQPTPKEDSQRSI